MRVTFVFIFSLLLLGSVIAQPSITSVSPLSGTVGSSVTINGNNFSSTPANNTVYFGNVKATVTSSTTTSIITTVPPGASYHPVTVKVNGLSASTVNPFIVTFNPNGNIDSLTLTFKLNLDTLGGTMTMDIKVADLDGDNKNDIIVSDRIGNRLSIYKNISTTTHIIFSDPIHLSAGSRPEKIAISDLNNDGKLDIVITNNVSNDVSLYRNNSTSDISFISNGGLSTASIPTGIVAADFDNDGKIDIAVSSGDLQGKISLFRNTSNATGSFFFNQRIEINSGGGPVNNIVTSDFNADGKIDLAVNFPVINSVGIIKNSSTLNSFVFANIATLTTSQLPIGLAVADFDNDTKPDLVTSNYDNGNLSVFRNTSSGGNFTFSTPGTLQAGTNPVDVAAGDMDGDGKVDLAVLNVSESISIFKNTSSPGTVLFNPRINYIDQIGDRKIAVADLDNDSKPDILVQQGFFRVQVFQNKIGSPQIFTFSPAIAGMGDTIKISGKNLSQVNSVTFGTLPASSFTIMGTDSIQAIAGNGYSGDVSVFSPYGNDSKEGFVFTAAPVVSGFSPATAGIYDTVTIEGYNFTATSTVTIGGVSVASIVSITPHKIKVLVGPGASGIVSVTSVYGTGTKPGFNFSANPTISNFTPATAATGTTVTITGTNFYYVTGVSFGGVPASSFSVLSSTQLTAIVGTGGASGNVQVTTAFGTANRPGFTYIPPPAITNVSSLTAGTGDLIVITGTNLTGVTNVYFGSLDADSIKLNSSTSINAYVGAGSSGFLKIVSPSGKDSVAGFNFIAPPKIRSLIPSAAPAGATIKIAGSGFSSIAGNNLVRFGSVNATVLAASADTLTVQVPAFSNTDKVSITINNRIAFGPVFKTTYSTTQTDFTQTSFGSQIFKGGFNSYHAIISDLNGDGKPELITSDNQNAVAIMKNISTIGNIAFEPRIIFPLNLLFDGLVVGDIDGDGKDELIVGRTGGFYPGVYIYKNNSTATNFSFGSPVALDWIYGAYFNNVVLSDVDQDGRLDILSYLSYSNDLKVYLNKSIKNQIRFAPAANVNIVSPTNEAPSLALADFDLDGKQDIVVHRYTVGAIFLKGKSSPGVVSFTGAVQTIGSENTFSTIDDMDNDGKMDFASIPYFSGGRLYRNVSPPDTIRVEAVFGTGDNAIVSMVFGDLDGDGKDDLVTRYAAWDFKVGVSKNLSVPGTILYAPRKEYIKENRTAYQTMAVGDLDGDSRMDIVTSYRNYDSVFVLRNNTGFIPTSLPDLDIIENLEVSPNPAKDRVTLNFNLLRTEDLLVEIIDNSGVVLHTDKRRVSSGRHSSVFDLSKYPAGIYFIRISSDKGSETKKIVISRD